MLDLGYGNLLFFKFADPSFTPNAFPEFILKHAESIRADDNVKDRLVKTTKTVVLSGGDKVVITQPTEDSASLEVVVLNPLADDLSAIAFVDSIKIVDGVKERRDYYDTIGLELSDWTNSFYFEFRPTDAQGNEVTANRWIIFKRAVMIPTRESERGKDESVTTLRIQSVGGTAPGQVASFTTDVDLTVPADLSVGLPYANNITIDQKLIENVVWGNGAATTRAAVLNILNNAYGRVVAVVNDTGGAFMDIFGRLASVQYGNLKIDPPTDLVTYQDGTTKLFDSGGGPVSEAATDPVRLPVRSEGDPTAV